MNFLLGAVETSLLCEYAAESTEGMAAVLWDEFGIQEAEEAESLPAAPAASAATPTAAPPAEEAPTMEPQMTGHDPAQNSGWNGSTWVGPIPPGFDRRMLVASLEILLKNTTHMTKDDVTNMVIDNVGQDHGLAKIRQVCQGAVSFLRFHTPKCRQRTRS